MQLFYHLMNGLGNRFLIFDARAALLDLQDESVIPQLANRYDIDQLILLGPGSKEEKSGEFDTKMLVWNRDGSRVDACGNAARCVGWLLTEESGEDCTKIKSGSRLQIARRVGAYEIEVDMGSPRLRWQDIPLNGDMIDQNSSTRVIELQVGPIDSPIISRPGCVSMGNPHCVFFVEDIAGLDVAALGSMLEHHPVFPQGANIGFAQILAEDQIRLRVWERGAGLTKACGTGACAALVAAHRRRLAGREAILLLDGGQLFIKWKAETDHVTQTGLVEKTGEGVLDWEKIDRADIQV